MRAAPFAAIAFTMAAGLFAIAQSEPPATDKTKTTTSTTTAPATTTVKDSALVRAAKQSGTRKKMPKKVITNEDVRKSKGKITVTQLKPLPPNSDAKSGVTDTVGSVEKADTKRRAHRAAEERVTAAQKKFNGLEKDLAAIEESYYEEKDLNLRDTVIQKRFAQTKRQLDDARKELADARDALSALTSRQ